MMERQQQQQRRHLSTATTTTRRTAQSHTQHQHLYSSFSLNCQLSEKDVLEVISAAKVTAKLLLLLLLLVHLCCTAFHVAWHHRACINCTASHNFTSLYTSPANARSQEKTRGAERSIIESSANEYQVKAAQAVTRKQAN